MIYLLIVLLFLAAIPFYNRYVPVYRVPCRRVDEIPVEHVILDIRDYNVGYEERIQGAVNLPVPYIARNLGEIPSRKVHLICASPLERNMGVRTLQKNGFEVAGFTMSNKKYAGKALACCHKY
jgi:rhodanese-related sulfurtransferase